MGSMDINQIERMMKLFSESNIGELFIKEGELEIELRKDCPCPPPPGPCPPPGEARPPFAPGEAAPAKPSFDVSAKQAPKGNVVVSPLVGTFYAAPSPDAEPFVKKGDTVKAGQVIGIVEAMKLMNEIECEFDGAVADVLVKNGEMVEYGQPLLVIQ